MYRNFRDGCRPIIGFDCRLQCKTCGLSCLRIFHCRKQSAEHPDISHADPCAGQGVYQCKISEYVKEHCRRHAEGKREDQAPFGIGRKSLCEDLDLCTASTRKNIQNRANAGRMKYTAYFCTSSASSPCFTRKTMAQTGI